MNSNGDSSQRWDVWLVGPGRPVRFGSAGTPADAERWVLRLAPALGGTWRVVAETVRWSATPQNA